MKILVDVNLAPAWVDVLQAHGYDAIHWTQVGDPRAPDVKLMSYARQHDCVLFTHDLDFGTMLALTRAVGPSVIQVRAQAVLPEDLSEIVTTTNAIWR
jgi:predicted nuclease of predicted toxin-antitoxin system